jgi:hypothetical protein
MTENDPVPQFSKAEFEPELVDSHGHFVRGVLFGVGGALVGLALYAAVVIITNYEIGFVSLAVGWLVGKAILMGSQGRTGRRYQVAALLLTYFAVSMATIPIVIWQIRQMNVALATPTSSDPAISPTPSPGAAAGSNVGEVDAQPIALSSIAPKLLWLGLTSPFYSLQDMPGGIISLIILAVGLRIAWKMTGTPQFAVQQAVVGPDGDTKPTSLDLNR